LKARTSEDEYSPAGRTLWEREVWENEKWKTMEIIGNYIYFFLRNIDKI
jgi:hypothetical protein